MIKAFGIIGALCAIVIAAVLAFAATRPDSFRVERTAVIKAPPERIFAQLNDLKAWSAWSPWETIDPQMKRSFSGATSGKGAAYAWEGNRDVGSGRMEITESVAPAKLVIALHFLKPFEARNTSEFTLSREGEATRVTWSLYGPSPFLSRLMGLFFSMDAMVGGQYEKGLATLKSITEK